MKGALFGLLVAAALFVPLERLFPRAPQKSFRPGWRADVLHFLFNNFLTQAAVFLLLAPLSLLLRHLLSPALQEAVASQPAWLQFAEAVLVADIGAYLGHRLNHSVPWLWKFHAVHHSSRELDWLASARLHPLDQALTRAMAIIPLFVLGFTRETFGAYLVFATLWAILLHANVRLRFPRWVNFFVGTPELHRWHHSSDPEAHDKNFAGQLPLLDLLLGTFYLPAERQPSGYGVEESIPEGYFAQLANPFRRSIHADKPPAAPSV